MIGSIRQRRWLWRLAIAFGLVLGTVAPRVQAQDTGLPGPFTGLSQSGSDETSGGRSGTSGYVENAIPQTMFRMRYDSARNDNRPDRAEFFYSQYRQQTITAGGINYVNTPVSGRTASGGGGKGGGKGRDDTLTQPGDVIGNPNARGLPKAETRVDYQDVSAYAEWAPSKRFSVFVEDHPGAFSIRSKTIMPTASPT